MNLISPKRIFKKKGGPFQAAFIIEKSVDYIVTEEDVKFTKSIITIYNSIPISPLKAAIPDVAPIDDETFSKYHKFQGLMNHCINSAERLNTQLRDVLLTVTALKPTREEILAMDFMSLRTLFSDFFNSYKPLKQKPEYDTVQKRKIITRTFFQYVTDRNIYTHGILKLRRPDETFVLQYLERKTIIAYAELTIEVLQSFLDVSHELRTILMSMQKLLQDERNSAIAI